MGCRLIGREVPLRIPTLIGKTIKPRLSGGTWPELDEYSDAVPFEDSYKEYAETGSVDIRDVREENI